jgi:hypothetical protein
MGKAILAPVDGAVEPSRIGSLKSEKDVDWRMVLTPSSLQGDGGGREVTEADM